MCRCRYYLRKLELVLTLVRAALALHRKNVLWSMQCAVYTQ